MGFSKSKARDFGYDTLERFTSGRGVQRVIGGETLRFPVRWSRYYEADYEPSSFKFFRRHCRSGDTVLDIGAHMGLFSVLAARCVGRNGRVFAFEPTPSTRRVLQKVVALNGCSHIVQVRGEAISGSSGEAIFHDTGDAVSNANSLIPSQRSHAGIRVATLTIDDLVRQRALTPQVLKIDVEGAEAAVLRGATQTFATLRPMVLLGLHPALLPGGETLREIWQLLQEYQMDVSLLNGGTQTGDDQERIGKPIDEAYFCSRSHHFDVQLTPR